MSGLYSCRRFVFFFVVLNIITGCRKQTIDNGGTNNGTPSSDSITYNPDWTFASHGNSAQNYTMIFPQDAVNTVELTMTANQWNMIKANMKVLTGSDFGSLVNQPPTNSTAEPDYVDVTMKFKGKVWKNVGFRLKGNSTLRTAWSSGNYKLPFRLNFDEFEDTYKGIANQHFYGFEEMSFSPGAKDPTLLHEKLASDIFRLAGIPAAQTAFYRVYIDFGAGLKYCGLYTGVELPDDNMIKSQFGEESGNIYKPESMLRSFIQSQFEKKNNEIAADYRDIQSFISALNGTNRISDPAQWRLQLESIFNIDHFLKYLAINNAIVNWDSYGIMPHNYYLYNHSKNKLTWIPWDHNEALTGSPGITGAIQTGPGARNGLSLTMNEVGSSWPLIRYLADDAVYMQRYKAYLREFREKTFTESSINPMIDKYYDLISQYVIGANGEQPGYTYLTGTGSFTSGPANLKSHITSRRTLIATYIP